MSDVSVERRMAAAVCRVLLTGTTVTRGLFEKMLALEGVSRGSYKKKNLISAMEAQMDILGYQLVVLGPDSYTLGRSCAAAAGQRVADVKYQWLRSKRECCVPATETEVSGQVLLVTLILVVYGNDISQADMREVLHDQFQLDNVALSTMVQDGYLVETAANNTVKLQLGPRVFREWQMDSMLAFLQQFFSNDGVWDEHMRRKCVLTLEKFWPAQSGGQSEGLN